MQDNIPFFDMVMLEKPLCLNIEGKRFKLYQPTIGKLLLLRPILERLSANDEGIDNAVVQALLKIEENRNDICEVLAIHSFKESRDCLDPFRTEERAAVFASLDNEQLATLFLSTLAFPKAEQIISGSEIDKDMEKRRQLIRAKDTKGSVFCGAKTLYGGLIDHAMERYGWSLQYALWGITAANLQLLATDEPTCIYLSPDERKDVPAVLLEGDNAIDGNDPANAQRIYDIFSRQNRH